MFAVTFKLGLMYTTHSLGSLTLQLFEPMKSHVSVADFCATAATVEFAANDGLLENDLILFKLSFPGFEVVGQMQRGYGLHSPKWPVPAERTDSRSWALHVAIQWTVGSIACGIAPWTGTGTP